MKKILLFLFCGIFMLGLSGCINQNNELAGSFQQQIENQDNSLDNNENNLVDEDFGYHEDDNEDSANSDEQIQDETSNGGCDGSMDANKEEAVQGENDNAQEDDLSEVNQGENSSSFDEDDDKTTNEDADLTESDDYDGVDLNPNLDEELGDTDEENGLLNPGDNVPAGDIEEVEDGEFNDNESEIEIKNLKKQLYDSFGLDLELAGVVGIQEKKIDQSSYETVLKFQGEFDEFLMNFFDDIQSKYFDFIIFSFINTEYSLITLSLNNLNITISLMPSRFETCSLIVSKA